MQVEMGGFNPVHVARLLAVSRAYFYADFASLANEKNAEKISWRMEKQYAGKKPASSEKNSSARVCMVMQ